MKNFRKFISSNKRNNQRLFLQLPFFALFGIVSLLVWQPTAQMKVKNSQENPSIKQFSFIGKHLQAAILSATGANNSPLIPTLGNYPNTMVAVGANTIVTPDAAPTSTTSINVSTNSNFKGTFVANPTTGVVRVTNAHPSGSYLVTVKAFDAMGMTTRTFTLTVINGTPCNGTVQFTNVPDVSVAGIPHIVAVGDFNNDGNQDIATDSGDDNTVSIRLGNGLGGFSGTTDVPVGSGPQSVAVGDFNNDGDQDIATANFLAATVSIRLGDGSGGFSGTTNVSVGAGPAGVAIGDFDNNGNQDFAGGIVSFGVMSGPGSVTVDHVNGGTGLQSLTVVGVPTNATVNIPAFTPGTFNPVVVTFTPTDPNQAVDFTLRAASTFHAANIRVRCGTPPPGKPEN